MKSSLHLLMANNLIRRLLMTSHWEVTSLFLQDIIKVLTNVYATISSHVKYLLATFVLTGGELPAAIIADAVVRLVPGVISDEQSALSDCFMDDMLSAPIYTRPRSYNGWDVPEILLSGNETKIRQWEFDQAMERTKRLRPDLLKE